MSAGIKLTLKDIQDKFKNYPVKLLSKTYKNNREDLSWQCLDCGYVFTKSEGKLSKNIARNKNTILCDKCADRIPLTKEIINTRVAFRNIECLSNTIPNRSAQLLWRCNKGGCGYTWSNTYTQVVTSGYGCSDCAGNIPYTLEVVQYKLAKRNIELLSDTYTGQSTIYTFQCLACGHEWDTTGGSVISVGTGCSECANNKKYSISTIQDYLKKHNIEWELLSDKYEKNKQNLQWRCLKCGHIFPRAFTNIKNKKAHECPECKEQTYITYNKTNAEKHKEEWLKIPFIVYVLRCFDAKESFYKIGITGRKVKHRLYGLPYKYEILTEIKTDKYTGTICEALLLEQFKPKQYFPKKKFGGYRECITEVDVNYIKEFISGNRCSTTHDTSLFKRSDRNKGKTGSA